MITFSMNKPSTRRKPEHSTVHCRDLCGGSTTGLRHVLSAMPELAEVEWYRKQWIPARGDEIVDLSLHPRNRVFRGTNTRSLQEDLIGRSEERRVGKEGRSRWWAEQNERKTSA